MEATSMFIDGWLDKEIVVHIYNGILLSHKNKQNWVSSNEVDETRAYYTEWNKSEREKQIFDINAYIWNIEKRYRWAYLQGRDRDTEVKDRCEHVGEGEDGTNQECGIDKHTLPGVRRVRNAGLGCNLWNDRMTSVHFQGKPFNITVIQVYAPTSNTEEADLNGSLKTYKTF